MLLINIAFRNIFRRRRRTIFTISTMGIGFILFALSISMSEGTYGTAIKAFIKTGVGQAQLNKIGYRDSKSIYDSFSFLDLNIDKLAKKIDFNWAPRVYSPSLAFVHNKTTALMLIGIDPKREKDAFTIKQKIKSGRYLTGKSDKNIMISAHLAKVLNVQIGDSVSLVGQGVDGSVANDIFKVRTILKGGNNSVNRTTCYLNIKDAQNFLSMKNQAHTILFINKTLSSKSLVQKLSKNLKLNNLEINPWQVVRYRFYKAMKADKNGMWISLFVIALMIALGVLNTVLMTILERKREYGLLKALGTRPLNIFTLVILESEILAFISVIIGLFLFIFMNYFMMYYGIAYPVPIEVADIALTHMYGTNTFIVYLYPSVIILLTALLVSILPGIRAAKTKAIKAIRAI